MFFYKYWGRILRGWNSCRRREFSRRVIRRLKRKCLEIQFSWTRSTNTLWFHLLQVLPETQTGATLGLCICQTRFHGKDGISWTKKTKRNCRHSTPSCSTKNNSLPGKNVSRMIPPPSCNSKRKSRNWKQKSNFWKTVDWVIIIDPRASTDRKNSCPGTFCYAFGWYNK